MPARKPLTFHDEIGKRLDLVLYQLQALQQERDSLRLEEILHEIEEARTDLSVLAEKVQNKVNTLRDAEHFAAMEAESIASSL